MYEADCIGPPFQDQILDIPLRDGGYLVQSLDCKMGGKKSAVCLVKTLV